MNSIARVRCSTTGTYLTNVYGPIPLFAHSREWVQGSFFTDSFPRAPIPPVARMGRKRNGERKKRGGLEIVVLGVAAAGFGNGILGVVFLELGFEGLG